MCLVNPNKTTQYYTAPIRRYLNMMETYVPQNKLRHLQIKKKKKSKRRKWASEIWGCYFRWSATDNWWVKKTKIPLTGPSLLYATNSNFDFPLPPMEITTFMKRQAYIIRTRILSFSILYHMKGSNYSLIAQHLPLRNPHVHRPSSQTKSSSTRVISKMY